MDSLVRSFIVHTENNSLYVRREKVSLFICSKSVILGGIERDFFVKKSEYQTVEQKECYSLSSSTVINPNSFTFSLFYLLFA